MGRLAVTRPRAAIGYGPMDEQYVGPFATIFARES